LHHHVSGAEAAHLAYLHQKGASRRHFPNSKLKSLQLDFPHLQICAEIRT
jgi:hypothetical protein